jgi:GTPase SAR1 family protein
VKYVRLDDCTLEVVDTAGQDKFQSDRTLVEGAECAVIMFDMTSRTSYKNVGHWLNYCEGIPTIVCGNKIDIREVKVDPVDVLEVWPDAQFTSAKTGHGVRLLLEGIVRSVM